MRDHSASLTHRIAHAGDVSAIMALMDVSIAVNMADFLGAAEIGAARGTGGA